MMTQPAPFPCDPQLWHRFLAACDARDETPGSVLRNLIRLEVQRAERRAEPAVRADPNLVARLRLDVAASLLHAGTWQALQTALSDRGLTYIASGGGLSLIDLETGEVLCKGSEVGPGYGELVRRFGCGFPGHPRPAIAAQALGARSQASC